MADEREMAAKRWEERVADRDQLLDLARCQLLPRRSQVVAPPASLRAHPRGFHWLPSMEERSSVLVLDDWIRISSMNNESSLEGFVFNVPVWSAVRKSAALVNKRDPVGSVLAF